MGYRNSPRVNSEFSQNFLSLLKGGGGQFPCICSSLSLSCFLRAWLNICVIFLGESFFYGNIMKIQLKNMHFYLMMIKTTFMYHNIWKDMLQSLVNSHDSKSFITSVSLYQVRIFSLIPSNISLHKHYINSFGELSTTK